MQIAICDDEQKSREQLAKLIKNWACDQNAEIDLSYYGSAEEFTMSWPEIPCDLIFLDIKMKNMNGMQLAETIRKRDAKIMIVFVTGFSQYSISGYNVDALNYLTKPISTAKLLQTLDKAHMIYSSRKNSFFIATKEKTLCKVFFDDIYSISMSAHYACIFTADASYKIRKSAKELDEMLPKYFVRCHRSHTVNIFKVERIRGNSLVLLNQEELPLSRNHAKQVKDAFVNLQAR